MDEASFEIDQKQLAESARHFPAHRRHAAVARPDADMSYMNAAPGVDFGRHAWDESGYL